jgi:hypothetical protein
MYCSNCGAETSEELRYCKRCGNGLTTALNSGQLRTSAARLTGMVWAIAALGVFGLGMIFGGTIGLAAVGVRATDVLGPIAVFSSFSLFGVLVFLIRMVSKLAQMPVQGEPAPVVRRRAAPRENVPQQIQAPPDMYSSVTEHTTHVFDPVQRKDTNPR